MVAEEAGRRRARGRRALVVQPAPAPVSRSIADRTRRRRAAAAPSGSHSPTIAGCPVFPSNNAWNEDVSKLPVRADSTTLVNTISSTGGKTMLHADFGGGGAYGIPFMIVPAKQKKEPIHYTAYGDESSPGPFPIPPSAPVEGGSSSDGDRHVLVVQSGTCHLYELYDAFWRGNHWDAGSGVNWNLTSNKLRPLGWTSADAAGLPDLPGPGALRRDRDRLDPPRAPLHGGGDADAATSSRRRTTRRRRPIPTLPPMGLRLRLKAGYSLARFHGESFVILQALKRYGMIVADNGSSWYITGAADPRWNDNDLDQLKTRARQRLRSREHRTDPSLAGRGLAWPGWPGLLRLPCDPWRRALRTPKVRRKSPIGGNCGRHCDVAAGRRHDQRRAREHDPGAALEPDVVHRVDRQGPDQPHGRRGDDVRDLGRAGLGPRRHAGQAHGRRQRRRRPEGRVGRPRPSGR